MKVLIRALPESGGGGLPLPEFFGPFFHQVIVPKKVIFYPKLTIFVGFFSIFCHHYHQNYQNFDQNYHGNNYYHHQYFFPPYAQNVVFVGRIKSVKLPELGGGGGGGLGNSGNARIEVCFSF